MKCVAGIALPITLAHKGIPKKGNKKPDNIIEGSITIIDICKACVWFCDIAEMVKPSDILQVIKMVSAKNNNPRLPIIGTPNSILANMIIKID